MSRKKGIKIEIIIKKKILPFIIGRCPASMRK